MTENIHVHTHTHFSLWKLKEKYSWGCTELVCKEIPQKVKLLPYFFQNCWHKLFCFDFRFSSALWYVISLQTKFHLKMGLGSVQTELPPLLPPLRHFNRIRDGEGGGYRHAAGSKVELNPPAPQTQQRTSVGSGRLLFEVPWYTMGNCISASTQRHFYKSQFLWDSCFGNGKIPTKFWTQNSRNPVLSHKVWREMGVVLRTCGSCYSCVGWSDMLVLSK